MSVELEKGGPLAVPTPDADLGSAPGLLDWLVTASERRGMRFAEAEDGWRFVSYAELAQEARHVAAWLLESGAHAGDVIPLIVPTGARCVSAFYGVMLAGCTPSPLVPPDLMRSPEQYVKHTGALLRGRRLAITDGACEELVTHSATAADEGPAVAVLPTEFPTEPPRAGLAEPAELALLQFTSGSVSTPRGVRITRRNLQTMVDYIFDWVGWEEDDAGAHWLPLYHDFGLIGGLIAPVTRQRDLWVMRPEQFVLQPGRWIDCFGRHGAAFSASPGFAFAYAMHRLDPDSLQGSDFSGWKGAILGAERLDAGVLDRFARALAPHGFSPRTFMPAYGMAEATLGATGVPRDASPAALRVDWASLKMGQRVEILQRSCPGEDFEDASGWLMSCGISHPGLWVEIRGEEGESLPQGWLGEIYLSGPTIAAGYEGEDDDGDFAAGWLRTGDAGFLRDGELYVTGRLGDAIKVRGRSVFAEDLELKLGASPGVPRGRSVVLAGAADEGAGSIVAIVEEEAGEWAVEARNLLARELAGGVAIKVFSAPRGTIMRTSSGKPRRRAMWSELSDGRLPVELVEQLPAEAVR